MRDDSELLRIFVAEKSNEAFSEIVRRHIGTVYAVALRRVGGNVHLAEDVVQEVFTDFARKAVSLSRRESLVGWLFVATRFATAKAVRKDRQLQSLQQRAEAMNQAPAQFDAEPAWEDLRPVLDDAIHGLTERDREAILLHFFDRRTFEDVGSKLRITESGARMRVERALEKMRLSLSRRGITSTTAALSLTLGTQAIAAVPVSFVTKVTTAALVGAVPTGAASVFYFMTITKTQLSIIAGAVLIGATVMGVIQQRKISTLLTERRVLISESASSAAQANELKAKLSDAERAFAALKGSIAETKSGNGSAIKTSPNNGGSGMTVIHMKDVLRDHPE
ncbi:MAG TPA: sigma-70 family RNA polymerase sigma factor, partial [Opitutaceae bacterium]|nr:sigma-70 family RNA polymerase sigma factor [Opitutaceae bacterium]